MTSAWLLKLLFAHLLTDFALQPKRWIEDRRKRHFNAVSLYWHTLITGVAALLAVGFSYWYIALIIMITHFFIDGGKSYCPDKPVYFVIDQALHLAVIFVCWYLAFFTFPDVRQLLEHFSINPRVWMILTAYLLISFPSGIFIGILTHRWSKDLPGAAGLEQGGKWIGILERVIILTFILLNQYAAIGLLITAKGLLRFNEKNHQEQKTEYVLIGSLISVVVALFTGLLVQYGLTQIT